MGFLHINSQILFDLNYTMIYSIKTMFSKVYTQSKLTTFLIRFLVTKCTFFDLLLMMDIDIDDRCHAVPTAGSNIRYQTPFLTGTHTDMHTHILYLPRYIGGSLEQHSNVQRHDGHSISALGRTHSCCTSKTCGTAGRRNTATHQQ